MSLARVFKDHRAALFGQFRYCVHIAHLSIEVYGHNSFDLFGMRAQIFPKSINVEIKRLRVDIDKLRRGAGLDDCFNSGDEGIRDRENNISLSDTSSH